MPYSLKETREHWFIHVSIVKKAVKQNKLGELFLTVNSFTCVEAHANSGGVWQEYGIVLLSIVSEEEIMI